MEEGQFKNLLEFYLYLRNNLNKGNHVDILTTYLRYIGFIPTKQQMTKVSASSFSFMRKYKFSEIEKSIFNCVFSFYTDVKIIDYNEIIGAFERNIGSVEMIKKQHTISTGELEYFINKNPRMFELFTKIN
jgi:hypothetical protein